MSLHIENMVKAALSPVFSPGKKLRGWAKRNKVGILLTLLSFFASFFAVTWYLGSPNTRAPEVASVVVVSSQPAAPPVSTVILSSTLVVQPPPPKVQAVREKTSTVVVTSVVTASPTTVTNAITPIRVPSSASQSASEKPDPSSSSSHPDPPSAPSQAQAPGVTATTPASTP